MFEDFKLNGEFLGWSYETPNRHFIFGARGLTADRLPQVFPKYGFTFLKQVHGRKVVPAEIGTQVEADGQYTQKPGLALIVQTADCLPVLLSSNDTVCGLHAGWRGLAGKIIPAVKETLPEFKPNFIATGPHIGPASFEVGPDVYEQLSQASKAPFPPVSGKALFDLQKLANAQIAETFGAGVTPEICMEDTMTSSRLESYRRDRDRERRGRQYSFVVIKS